LALTGQNGQSTASYLGSAADWPPPRGARYTQTQSGRFLRRPMAGFYSAVDNEVVDACCQAWNFFAKDPDAIQSIATRDYARTVSG